MLISGYSYFDRGHQCSSTITEGETVVFLRPTKDGESWTHGTPTTTSFTFSTTAVGDGVPIWWQSSDAEVLASVSTMMPTNQPTIGASITSNSSGLMTGAKIGIGIGIPMAVIAGLVIGLIFSMKRRRDRKANESRAEHEGGYAEEKTMPVAPAYTIGQTEELDSNARHELPNVDSGSRHELPDVAHR